MWHLFPAVCLLCDQRCPGERVDLCRHCRRALPWNAGACPRCALPWQPAGAGAGPCPQCVLHPPPPVRVLAPLVYAGAVARWVQRLKYRHGLVEGRVLGTLLGEAAAEAYRGADVLPEVIVPVPLSGRRLARRGLNQAVVLATAVRRVVGGRLYRTGARRQRHTAAQQGLPRAARQQNLAGAFRSRPWHGERVAVVDDVLTTGATTNNLALALLAAGAGEVHVWCCARTPLPGAPAPLQEPPQNA